MDIFALQKAGEQILPSFISVCQGKKEQKGFSGLVKFSRDWPRGLEWSKGLKPLPANSEMCWCLADRTGPTPAAHPHSQPAHSTFQSSSGSLFVYFSVELCSKIALLWYLKQFQVKFWDSERRGQFRFTCSRADSFLPSACYQELKTRSGLRIGAAGLGFPKFLISSGMQIFLWVLCCKSQSLNDTWAAYLHGGKFFPLLSTGDRKSVV